MPWSAIAGTKWMVECEELPSSATESRIFAERRSVPSHQEICAAGRDPPERQWNSDRTPADRNTDDADDAAPDADMDVGDGNNVDEEEDKEEEEEEEEGNADGDDEEKSISGDFEVLSTIFTSNGHTAFSTHTKREWSISKRVKFILV